MGRAEARGPVLPTRNRSTGSLDAKTRGAVIAFQKWEGLTRNGEISAPPCWNRLQTASQAHAVQERVTQPLDRGQQDQAGAAVLQGRGSGLGLCPSPPGARVWASSRRRGPSRCREDGGDQPALPADVSSALAERSWPSTAIRTCRLPRPAMGASAPSPGTRTSSIRWSPVGTYRLHLLGAARRRGRGRPTRAGPRRPAWPPCGTLHHRIGSEVQLPARSGAAPVAGGRQH